MPGPIDTIIASAAESIAALAQRVAAGQISSAQWYREMQIELKRNWATSYRAALGRAPTRAEQRWLQQEYNKHNVFVRGFRDDIAAGNLSEVQIANRASMYADRLRGLYEAGGAAAEGMVLPFVPGSGSTACLTNCKCFLSYEEQDGQKTAIWNLTPAEHCDDCLMLAGKPHTEWRMAIGA